MALPEEMAALHKALHLQRVVIVTPSVYGTERLSGNKTFIRENLMSYEGQG
jgi:hypothetical protein